MKESVILKNTNVTIDEVWYVYTKNTVPNPAVRKNIGIKEKRLP